MASLPAPHAAHNEGDLKAFLHTHSVFTKIDVTDEGDKGEHARNLLAHNLATDELFVYSPKTAKLFVVALNSWSKTRSEQVQELALDPTPPGGIRQILCHKNGKVVCLVGASRCAIVDVEEKRSKFYTGSLIQCRVQHVAAYLHAAKPSMRVLQVEWHPFSESHFGVLTSDNALRLYELSNLEDSEQTFHLFSLTTGSTPEHGAPYSPYNNAPATPSRSPYTSTPKSPMHPSSPYKHEGESGPSRASAQVPEAVAFSFGAGNGWTAFSVFFLSTKGHIYCICPVIPHYARIPKLLIASLNEAIIAKIKVLKDMGTDDVLPYFGYYNAQLKWLREIQGDRLESDREIENVTLSSSDGVVETSPPTNKLNLILQGPMDKDYPGEPPPGRTKPCGLVYISYDKPSSVNSLSPPFGFLAKLFAGGTVDILLNVEDTNPQWIQKNKSNFLTYVPQLIFFEQVNFELPKGIVNIPTPIFLPSVFHPHHLLVMDVTGICSLQFVWLEKLRECIDAENELTELPPLPKSQIVRIVNAAPLGPQKTITTLGMALLNHGMASGYFAAILFGSLKCNCIDIPIAGTLDAPTKVLHGVTKPLRKEPQPFEYLASRAPLPIADMLVLLRTAIAKLRKEYIGYILGCEADARENFELLNAEIQEQTRNLQAERQRIEEHNQQCDRVERRIAGCLRVQESAAIRIKNVLTITNTSKVLSKAERDFFKELYEYYYTVHTKLRSKLEEISYLTEKEIRRLKVEQMPHVKLEEEQLTHISAALQDEYQTISQTAQSVKDLEAALGQLQLPDQQ